jgi:hypothetical protein
MKTYPRHRADPIVHATPNKGPTLQVKLILLATIIVIAGAVLAVSLIRKSRMTATAKPSPGYTVARITDTVGAFLDEERYRWFHR